MVAALLICNANTLISYLEMCDLIINELEEGCQLKKIDGMTFELMAIKKLLLLLSWKNNHHTIYWGKSRSYTLLIG